MGIESELVYVCIYIYLCLLCFRPRGPPGGRGGGGKHVFKMASYQLHGCRLCTSGTRTIRDQDKSTTYFYPGRLTTATKMNGLNFTLHMEKVNCFIQFVFIFTLVLESCSTVMRLTELTTHKYIHSYSDGFHGACVLNLKVDIQLLIIKEG